MVLTTQPARRFDAASLVDLLAATGRLSDLAGRPDLEERLGAASSTLVGGAVRVAVLGVPGAGASRLVQVLTAAGQTRLPGMVFTAPGAEDEAADRAGNHDVALYLTEASRAYSQVELDSIARLRAEGVLVACVLTKIDLHPGWLEVQTANRTALAEAGIGGGAVPILPVSTTLGDTAGSGVPQLVTFLDKRVAGRVDPARGAAVLATVHEVTETLAEGWHTQLAELTSGPAQREAAERERRAVAELERLTDASSQWQTTLNDGTTDLMAQVEHDLRRRLRDLVQQAETEISDTDPAPRWAAIDAWLRQAVATALAENLVFARQRARALADQVAASLAGSGEPVSAPEIRLVGPSEVLDTVRRLGKLESRSAGLGPRLVTSLRGSYGGVLMVGVVTSLAGLALVNVWSIAAGVLLGVYTFFEDRRVRIERRGAEAKIAVAKHLDDVVFEAAEQTRTELRAVHRTLRGFFAAVNDQRLRAGHQAVQAAVAARAAQRTAQDARLARLRGNLAELDRLRARLTQDPPARGEEVPT